VRFADDHPDYIPKIGIVSSVTGGIIIDHIVFSKFLGIKPNSLARNFRDHGFQLDREYDPSRELLTRLPDGVIIDTRKWVLRKYAGYVVNGAIFVRSTSEERQTELQEDDNDDFASPEDSDWVEWG
jgi:hypothetical protein